MWTNHLTLSRLVWYMDGWFLLHAGAGRGEAVACLSAYYKTQIQRTERKGLFSLDLEFLNVRVFAYLTALITPGVILISAASASKLHAPNRRDCVALKGESWSTSWQMSLATEAETTQCSSSERTGFKGCQILFALSSALATQSNHLIEMWEATDISVFPWLSPLSHSSSMPLTV